jgi:hypothetical protein
MIANSFDNQSEMGETLVLGCLKGAVPGFSKFASLKTRNSTFNWYVLEMAGAVPLIVDCRDTHFFH